MKTISIFLSFFLAGLNGRFAMKIAMMPLFIQRHFLVFSKLGEELGRRGHEVIIFVGDQVANYTNGQEMIQIFSNSNSNKIIDFVNGKSISQGILPMAKLLILYSLQKDYCNDFLNDNTALNELKTAELLVGDSIYACSALAAAKLRIPHVVVETPLSSPSYTQEMLAKFDRKTNGFLDSLQFYINRLGLRFMFYTNPIYLELKSRHGIKLEESIQETLTTMDLFLLERYFTEGTAILPEYVKTVGRLLPGPDDAISAEMEDFMSSTVYGVILVSTDYSAVDDRIKTILEKVFSEIPQKVIWKTTGKYDMVFPSNIRTVECFPQSILGHNKTKVLIVDAVMVDVALYAARNGVPMLWLKAGKELRESPINLLKDVGLGELVDLHNTSVGQIVGLIKQIILDKRYKEKAIQFSRIVNLCPRTPLKEAAEIIENVHSDGMDNRACFSGTKGLGSSDDFLDVFIGHGILLILVLAVVKRVVEVWHSQKVKIT